MKDKIKFVPVAPKTYEVRYVENQGQSSLSKFASYLGIRTVYNCSTCDKDEKTIEFKAACPGEKCDNRTASYWQHNNDDCIKNKNRMLISNRGYLSCGGCGTGYNMANWEFACSKHEGKYRQMSKDSWNKSMALALNVEGVNEVTQDLNVYVTNHSEKFGFKKN